MNPQLKTYQDDESIQKRRWSILIILNLFVFMSTLDGSIVNIALPVISKELHLEIFQSQLVASSYLIAICTFILFFGKLGDIFGKIKIFKLGTVIFVIGSLLCGFSSSLPVLIIFRVIQAIGASMTMADSQGIVTDIFPPGECGKALVSLGLLFPLEVSLVLVLAGYLFPF